MISHPDKLLVTFWGGRGSIPTPGRNTEKYGGNTACVEVSFNNDHLILDAGTGIRNLGISLLSRKDAVSKTKNLTLLLSHTHWDHIQGLPFFGPAYLPETNLRILGRGGKGKDLPDILRGQMDMDYFPVDLSMLGANLEIAQLTEKSFNIGDMHIEWQEQYYHPGGSLRFKVTAGEKTMVYSTDIELEQMFDADQSNQEAMSRKQEYLECIKDVDFLIADGQYTAQEYESKKGWGHTAVPRLLEIAHSAGVKKVAVFHHDPMASDRKLDELAVQYGREYSIKDPSMSVLWSREGMTIEV